MSAIHDVAVVGAGITGLTAAFELRRAGRSVVVLESAERVGGAISTLSSGEWRLELGPNTVVETPALAALIGACGLSEQKLEALPGARRRYLWHRGRLLPLPANPLALLASPLLSARAKWRVLREPRAPGPPDHEESVADFARRRLGGEVLAAIVEPMVSGVYAGDPERLSLALAFPRIAAMERDHGSLLRAARRARPEASGKRTVITLRDGLESLPRRLAEACGPVRTGTPCLGIKSGAGLFTLSTSAGDVAARRLVVATPAAATAQLLEAATAGRSAAFREVPYASAAVVAFGFQRRQVQHQLDGFGFLVPRGSGLRILGCVFPSTVFPERAPPGHVALTAILGGKLDQEISGWDDSQLQETALADLRRALGISGEPVIATVGRWPRAIPQPELGHGRFLDLAVELEQRLPGLVIAGSFLGGVAVGDCVERGVRAAMR